MPKARVIHARDEPGELLLKMLQFRFADGGRLYPMMGAACGASFTA